MLCKAELTDTSVVAELACRLWPKHSLSQLTKYTTRSNEINTRKDPKQRVSDLFCFVHIHKTNRSPLECHRVFVVDRLEKC